MQQNAPPPSHTSPPSWPSVTRLSPRYSTPSDAPDYVVSSIGWTCQRGSPIQAGRHGVPLPAWSGTSAPPDHLTPASDVASRLRLRSANRQQLLVPRCRLDTCGRRAFFIAGPTVWNSLPDELRDPTRGSDSFKQFLKTILFSFY